MSSILPTTNNTFGPSSSSSTSYYNQSGRHRKGSPALLRRLFRFPQMDFEVGTTGQQQKSVYHGILIYDINAVCLVADGLSTDCAEKSVSWYSTD